MTIRELVDEAHDNARDKGFYDNPSEIGTLIALIHAELGEATEALRRGNVITLNTSMIDGIIIEDFCNNDYFVKYVKDTFEDELADVVIRVADLCGYMGIDLESHIKAKMAYNKTRPQLHGKRF